MTPYTAAWVLSLTAASFFFAAGLLFARHRAALAAALPQPGTDLTPVSLAQPKEGLRTEREPAGARERAETPLEPVISMGNSTSGEALRAVLMRESDRSGLTGAVIADELGLVVASTGGEHSDALAAYGAVLAGIGTKTGDALPLRDVRQVVVKDDHDMTLTVRKIASVDEQFALVTLTTGQDNAAPTVAAPGR